MFILIEKFDFVMFGEGYMFCFLYCKIVVLIGKVCFLYKYYKYRGNMGDLIVLLVMFF